MPDTQTAAAAQDWLLSYDSFDPAHQGVREALTTLGNGLVCTRGAMPWAWADDTHYPGSYLAGGYNRLLTRIGDRDIENEDLVNLPAWPALTWRVDGGRWFRLETHSIDRFRQELDIRTGALTLDVTVTDDDGRNTRVVAVRMVSMNDKHLMAQSLTLEPQNWSGQVDIEADLDGNIINWGVKRYRQLSSRHLDVEETAVHEIGDIGPAGGEPAALLVTQTNQSQLRIGQAARLRAFRNGVRVLDVPTRGTCGRGHAALHLRLQALQGQALRLEKVCTLFTSRDTAISQPALAAIELLQRAPDMETLARDHATAWQRLWHQFDTRIDAGDDAQMITRLHLFHLLQTLSPHVTDQDTGVPARGWHGEAYRGHVFWDAAYILPVLTLRRPEISEALIHYRIRRLPAARRAAAVAGHQGAMFPWQSGSDGREESQIVHLNPKSGRWVPDNSWLQRHVNLAIAYDVWFTHRATRRSALLQQGGAELVLEITRFFASLASHDEAEDRFHIRKVMGPDEFHEAYPGVDEEDGGGLDDNAYTNVMVAWLTRAAEDILGALDDEARAELLGRLGVDDAERARWEHMSRRMFVPFHDGDIISQFAGYERLKEFDWDGYRAKYGDIQRLDRILEAEGDSADHYKLSKQADTLMLFYLFDWREVAVMFERLGYTLTEDTVRRNIDYYLARTSHGSTLSYLVHAWILARLDTDRAWDLFRRALNADVNDIQGGTTAEGIHLGLMAGTVDLIQRCLTGMTITAEGGLRFEPVVHDRIRQIATSIRFHGQWLDLSLADGSLSVHHHAGQQAPVTVTITDETRVLQPGDTFIKAVTG